MLCSQPPGNVTLSHTSSTLSVVVEQRTPSLSDGFSVPRVQHGHTGAVLLTVSEIISGLLHLQAAYPEDQTRGTEVANPPQALEVSHYIKQSR